MVIQIKDNNGRVVAERKIEKEEVTLKITVKEDGEAGIRDCSPEETVGAYH